GGEAPRREEGRSASRDPPHRAHVRRCAGRAAAQPREHRRARLLLGLEPDVISRRRFLLGALALGVPVPRLVGAAGPALAAHPFSLGVASGYPTPTGMTLWTRLMGIEAPTSVAWEVAADDAMRKVVRSGEAHASAEWAHSVHVD